jgi:hypothetical protein
MEGAYKKFANESDEGKTNEDQNLMKFKMRLYQESNNCFSFVIPLKKGIS